MCRHNAVVGHWIIAIFAPIAKLGHCKSMGKFADLESLNDYSGYGNSNFASQSEPSGFEKIRTTMDPGASFNVSSNNNLSASSMNDDDDDMPF